VWKSERQGANVCVVCVHASDRKKQSMCVSVGVGVSVL